MYTVVFTEWSTGLKASLEYPEDWESARYWWITGNFACDCNRATQMQIAQGLPINLLTFGTCSKGLIGIEVYVNRKKVFGPA